MQESDLKGKKTSLVHIDFRAPLSAEDQTRYRLLSKKLTLDVRTITLKRNLNFFTSKASKGNFHEIQHPNGKIEHISLSHAMKKVDDSNESRVIVVGIGKEIKDPAGDKILAGGDFLGKGSYAKVKTVLLCSPKSDKSAPPKYGYVLKIEEKPLSFDLGPWLKSKIRQTAITREIEGECSTIYSPTQGKMLTLIPRIPEFDLDFLVEKVIKQNPISFEEWLTIMLGIFKYIKEIQEKNIIHRDPKSANFMYDRKTGAIRGIDYTFSFKENDPYGWKPRMGTPLFISPDAIRGYLDKTTDLYSIGGIGGQLASFFHRNGLSLVFKHRVLDIKSRTKEYDDGEKVLLSSVRAPYSVFPGFNFEDLNPKTIPVAFQDEIKRFLYMLSEADPRYRLSLDKSIDFIEQMLRRIHSKDVTQVMINADDDEEKHSTWEGKLAHIYPRVYKRFIECCTYLHEEAPLISFKQAYQYTENPDLLFYEDLMKLTRLKGRMRTMHATVILWDPAKPFSPEIMAVFNMIINFTFTKNYPSKHKYVFALLIDYGKVSQALAIHKQAKKSLPRAYRYIHHEMNRILFLHTTINGFFPVNRKKSIFERNVLGLKKDGKYIIKTKELEKLLLSISYSYKCDRDVFLKRERVHLLERYVQRRLGEFCLNDGIAHNPTETEDKKLPPISNLSEELLDYVFSYLSSATDFLNTSLVNRHWHQVVQRPFRKFSAKRIMPEEHFFKLLEKEQDQDRSDDFYWEIEYQRVLILNELLFNAIENNNFSLAKLCLILGADINAQNEDGKTIVHIVSGNNTDQKWENVRRLKQLKQHCSIDLTIQDNQGLTPILIALKNNNLSFVDTFPHDRLKHSLAAINSRNFEIVHASYQRIYPKEYQYAFLKDLIDANKTSALRNYLPEINDPKVITTTVSKRKTSNLRYTASQGNISALRLLITRLGALGINSWPKLDNPFNNDTLLNWFSDTKYGQKIEAKQQHLILINLVENVMVCYDYANGSNKYEKPANFHYSSKYGRQLLKKVKSSRSGEECIEIIIKYLKQRSLKVSATHSNTLLLKALILELHLLDGKPWTKTQDANRYIEALENWRDQNFNSQKTSSDSLPSPLSLS